ncbi:MAG TPA: hypothetical protein VKA94_13795, partial [Hyphomicrobiales bacterium]|nr:hypothetical protein [Hyphomicrobiales bacterium]
YLVHMRQPGRLMRELGFSGFLALQGHFAGIILAALVYPVAYILIAYDAMMGWLLSQPQSILGHHLLVMTIFILVAGFTGSFALGLSVLKRRHMAVLLPQIPLMPLYWLLISVAVYRALYQLLTAPHYWEKTEHFGVVTAGIRGKPARRMPDKTANPKQDVIPAVMQPGNWNGASRSRYCGSSRLARSASQ